MLSVLHPIAIEAISDYNFGRLHQIIELNMAATTITTTDVNGTNGMHISSPGYRAVDLYGGALTTLLPSTFADVADLRQVPDNQEVYLDTEGFTSVVFDLLERVEKPDEEALKYHLSDVVDGEEGVKVWGMSQAVCSKL